MWRETVGLGEAAATYHALVPFDAHTYQTITIATDELAVLQLPEVVVQLVDSSIVPCVDQICTAPLGPVRAGEHSVEFPLSFSFSESNFNQSL